MRPYPGHLTEESAKIYNYKHSRARRVIENAFVIPAAKWRIFQTPIRANVENVEKYTAACLALQNYLRLTNNAYYCPAGFTDSEDQNWNIKQGEWPSAVDGGQSVGNMLPLLPVRGRRYQNDALSMRDALKTYVNREEGSVPWQVDYVRRTAHYATQL